MVDKATTEPLNSLAYACFAMAYDHEFWDEGKSPTALSSKLALIHSEVSEALEEIRDPSSRLHVLGKTDEGKPVGFPSELADIIIRTLDLAYAVGVDMDEAVRTKMAYNATRPVKHGKTI